MAGEKLLERKLREQVKKMGGWAVKFWAVNLAGFPDRIVLMPRGRIWFVEMKTTGKNPTPIQRLMHTKLQDLGFEIRVISTDEQLLNFLNELK
jgi:hypothetical protein